MRGGFLTFALAALAASPAVAQVPAGPEFRVNTYTTDDQTLARAAVDAAGRITITWTSRNQATSGFSVWAQRYAPDGGPTGGELLVPTLAIGSEGHSDVACSRAGKSVVVWHGDGSPGFDIHAQRYARDQTAQGAEFTVNSDTSRNEYRPKAASLPGGGFVVAWSAHAYPATFNRVMTRRFDAFGFPLGPDVQASETPAAVSTNFPAIGSADTGAYVVVWQESAATPPGFTGIAGRLYDPSGAPVGPKFVVESTPAVGDRWPDVAMAGDGSFVVVWQVANDGSLFGIRARRFSASGAPLGNDFLVNAATAGSQTVPKVSANQLGDFVVAWSSGTGSPGSYDVVARRFAASGTPRGGDFPVNTATALGQFADDVASDGVGNFLATWTGDNDGSGFGVFARRFGGLLPAALAVDPAASASSDGNGVMEPGETIAVRPSWRNVNAAAQTFTGTMPLFAGPAGAVYGIVDGAASYGTVPPAVTTPCVDCYAVAVSAPSPRPIQHWDAFAEEDIAPDAQGQRKMWRLHVGDSFADVPRSSPFYRWIETLIHHFVTAGCTATDYCPQTPTTREQMAVFVVVARDAAGDPPPDCGPPRFADVPAASGYCRWIEELARSGVVNGCGGGNYCPSAAVSREEMAVFTLRTLDPAFAPPACTAPMFADVAASSPFCPWIEELARRNVVTGCGGGNYCPQAAVTREQMAVFISRTFGLELYGP